MGDRTRLFLTGLAAVGAVAVTIAAPKPWSSIHINDDDEEQVSVPFASLKNFDGIKVDGPDDVVVTQGDAFDVTVEGNKGVQRFVRLYVQDGVLHVARHGPWRGDATVHVTMPGLTRVWLAGPGDMEVEGLQGKDLKLLLAGSGDLKMGNLKAENVALSITGSGSALISGTAGALDGNLTGSGDAQLEALDAKNANISVSGSGSVQAHAGGAARLNVSGSGDAHVEGTTQCQIVKSGSGDAECTT